jgi:hypothetical protein
MYAYGAIDWFLAFVLCHNRVYSFPVCEGGKKYAARAGRGREMVTPISHHVNLLDKVGHNFYPSSPQYSWPNFKHRQKRNRLLLSGRVKTERPKTDVEPSLLKILQFWIFPYFQHGILCNIIDQDTPLSPFTEAERNANIFGVKHATAHCVPRSFGSACSRAGASC